MFALGADDRGARRSCPAPAMAPRDPQRPRRRARRLPRVGHARLALVGRRARHRGRPAAMGRARPAVGLGHRRAAPRPRRARRVGGASTSARPRTSRASSPCRARPSCSRRGGPRPLARRDLRRRAAGHRAPARRGPARPGRARHRRSACAAASPTRSPTCWPRASSASTRRTASCSRTLRPASRPAARPGCTSSGSRRRWAPRSSRERPRARGVGRRVAQPRMAARIHAMMPSCRGRRAHSAASGMFL